MISQRSERAWIPAAVASLALVAGLFGAWALDKAFLGNAGGPDVPSASFLTWVRDSDNLFFGRAPFSTDGRALIGTLAAVVVIALLGTAGTWWALRGLRPGSALPPAFLSSWMVLLFACVVAALVRSVVVAGSTGDSSGLSQYSAMTSGVQAGLRLGWIAALIGLAAWVVVRPGADASPDQLAVQDDDDPDRAPEFVMKRRADFNLEDRVSAERNAETYGRRESDRLYGGGDTRTTELPMQDSEPAGRPYVGRRSSGRYAEDSEEAVPDPEAPGGSHRG